MAWHLSQARCQRGEMDTNTSSAVCLFVQLLQPSSPVTQHLPGFWEHGDSSLSEIIPVCSQGEGGGRRNERFAALFVPSTSKSPLITALRFLSQFQN